MSRCYYRLKKYIQANLNSLYKKLYFIIHTSMINLDFHVLVEKISDRSQIFKKNFRMYMREMFLLSDQHKKHNLINHIYRMKNMIKMNHMKEVNKRMTKRQIYYVDFGINV